MFDWLAFISLTRQLDHRELSFLEKLLCTGTRHNRNECCCRCCIVKRIGYDGAKAKPNGVKKGLFRD
jgi:hypothetical protein